MPTAKTNETPRSTFRLPAATLARLDELAAQDAAGGKPNKTRVLIALVDAEHARRKPARK